MLARLVTYLTLTWAAQCPTLDLVECDGLRRFETQLHLPWCTTVVDDTFSVSATTNRFKTNKWTFNKAAHQYSAVIQLLSTIIILSYLTSLSIGTLLHRCRERSCRSVFAARWRHTTRARATTAVLPAQGRQ